MEIGSGGTRSRAERARPEARSAAPTQRLRPVVAPQFLATASVPCPYVPGRAERKLIVELSGRGAAAFFDELSRAGFRRSHQFAYRPACRLCSACVPVRIAVDRFVHTRSTRRVRNLNAGPDGSAGAITARIVPPRASDEQFRLFCAYQRSRHRDSDMAAMTFGDYQAMVDDSPGATKMIELRDAQGTLWGTGLYDPLDDGLSAVYSFYSPEAGKRSLGTVLVLALVDEARRRRLPFVYLGYWIADSAKMSYKARFRPLEALGPKGWQTILE